MASLSSDALVTAPNGSAESALADVYDIAALIARCMGSVDVAKLLLGKFATGLPKRIDELAAAVGAADYPRAKSLAHAIKGEAAALAAAGLQGAAARLEEALRTDRVSQAGELTAHVRLEAHRCVQAAPSALARVS
jgi:HPt (histidine-containing phosphotransfer) domain-containing protein